MQRDNVIEHIKTLRTDIQQLLTTLKPYTMEVQKMYKKDYIMIAKVIKDSKFYSISFQKRLADEFIKDNPKFDKDKFFKACGV